MSHMAQWIESVLNRSFHHKVQIKIDVFFLGFGVTNALLNGFDAYYFSIIYAAFIETLTNPSLRTRLVDPSAKRRITSESRR